MKEGQIYFLASRPSKRAKGDGFIFSRVAPARDSRSSGEEWRRLARKRRHSRELTALDGGPNHAHSPSGTASCKNSLYRSRRVDSSAANP